MPRFAVRPAALPLALLLGVAACSTPSQDPSMFQTTPCAAPLTRLDPAPTPDPQALALLSRTERFQVPLARAAFVDWLERAPLERLLPGAGGIPAVTATQPIGALPFPQPGSRRRVCLADGSSAVEQVLEHEAGRRLRYIVWSYTTPAAEPIAYGVGEFQFRDAGAGGTDVQWTYAFRLKEDRFPGLLGAAGRALFRLAFLDTRYARFMRAGAEAMTREAMAAR